MQSPEFIPYIKKQNVADNKLIYYPYYAEDFYKVEKLQENYLESFPKGFNLLFAGNIGIAQSFDTIISAFEKLKDHNINLIILGDGRDKNRIQKRIDQKGLSDKFYFLGSYPSKKMPHYFACADALLISLKKADIFSYTIPGKLQSYLACGKPIIGALDGIGKKIIEESNSGLCGNAENATDLANNIFKLYDSTKQTKEDYSKNAIKYFKHNFAKEKLLSDLEKILEK